MSYPPALYDGDGEVSAWLRPGDEPYFEGLHRLASGEEWTKEEYAAFMIAHDNHWVEE